MVSDEDGEDLCVSVKDLDRSLQETVDNQYPLDRSWEQVCFIVRRWIDHAKTKTKMRHRPKSDYCIEPV